MSVFGSAADGSVEAGSLMALWVSFEAPPSCAGFDHCCNITSDIAAGLDSAGDGCSIGPPAWKCYGGDDEPWSAGQPVSTISFEAGLANSPMAAGGKSVLLQLGNDADLSVPLSNTYAEHAVHDSPACRSLCAGVASRTTAERWSLFADADARGCKLAAAPRFRARSGYGRIAVRGFGRINGQTMQRGFRFKNENGSVWDRASGGPGAGALNVRCSHAVSLSRRLANPESIAVAGVWKCCGQLQEPGRRGVAHALARHVGAAGAVLRRGC